MDRFRHGRFFPDRGHQALDLVDHLGDPVEAGVQQGRRCIAGHGLDCHWGKQAKSCWSNQQLLEEFHCFITR
jgi:hypothetical protein